MPQTSKEMQDIIDKWFPFDKWFSQDQACIEFLESHGFILNKNWTWNPPAIWHTVSWEEYICIKYLIEEWDFGDLNFIWNGKFSKCNCYKCVPEKIYNDFISTDN